MSNRLERLHRLADKVQRDCRTSEDLLDDVERRLNEVVHLHLLCLYVVAAAAGVNMLLVRSLSCADLLIA